MKSYFKNAIESFLKEEGISYGNIEMNSDGVKFEYLNERIRYEILEDFENGFNLDMCSFYKENDKLMEVKFEYCSEAVGHCLIKAMYEFLDDNNIKHGKLDEGVTSDLKCEWIDANISMKLIDEFEKEFHVSQVSSNGIENGKWLNVEFDF